MTNTMRAIHKANPTLERTDLHNAHVIDWKWFLQDTRGIHWPLISHVCWIDGYDLYTNR